MAKEEEEAVYGSRIGYPSCTKEDLEAAFREFSGFLPR